MDVQELNGVPLCQKSKGGYSPLAQGLGESAWSLSVDLHLAPKIGRSMKGQ